MHSGKSAICLFRNQVILDKESRCHKGVMPKNEDIDH